MKKPFDPIQADSIQNTTQPEDLEDDLRPEYEEETLRGLIQSGTRGKYAERTHQNTNVVKLDPDVAALFPTERAVNDALRRLAARGVGV